MTTYRVELPDFCPNCGDDITNRDDDGTPVSSLVWATSQGQVTFVRDRIHLQGYLSVSGQKVVVEHVLCSRCSNR